MSASTIEKVFELPKIERIRLAKELLESVTEEEDNGELSDELKRILDERIAYDNAHPNEEYTWEDIKADFEENKSAHAGSFQFSRPQRPS